MGYVKQDPNQSPMPDGPRVGMRFMGRGSVLVHFGTSGIIISVCKLNIVLLSLWGLMHKIYPTSRY